MAGDALLQSVLDGFDEVVFAVDTELRYTAFNRGHAETMRLLYGAEIALGERLIDYQTVAADRATAEANLQRALAGEQVIAEAPSGEDERARRFEVSHTPLHDRDGVVTGVLVRARDVTDQRALEAALAKSESDFRDVFDDSPIGKAVTGPTGAMVVNQAFCDMLGYTRAEFADVTWQAITHPEDLAETERQMAALASGERETVRFTQRCIRKDGSVLWAEVHSRLRRGTPEDKSHFMTSAIDVTARHQAEEALRSSEERYRRLFEGMAEGFVLAQVVVADDGTPADLRLVDCNPAFERIIGLDVRRVSESLLRDFPMLDASWVQRLGRVALGGRPDGFEAYFAPLDLWLDVRASQAAQDTVAVVFTDVTERRRAEIELAESQALLQAAMDRSLAGIAIADAPDGRLRYVNRAGLMIRGGATEDVVDQVDAARYVASWRILHHDGTPYRTDEVPLARAVLYGETAEAEFLIRRDDEEDRVVVARAAPIHDADGNVTAGVVVFHDVTERKAAEEEVCRLNDELERRVVSRTQQLEAANRELEAFAYSVSHDLRAPLRAIDGFSAMVAEDAADRLTDEERANLQRVRAAAQRMARLIDDLLGLSRVSQRMLDREDVDVSALAGEVVAELRESDPLRRVDALVAPGLRAHADPVLLRLVLANLIGNAWKFTARRETAHVEVGAVETEGERAFFVRDDGVGFDMRHAAHLFGVFQRMHAAREFEGEGIGLATVKRLVARHGGRVWAEAEVGRGATFYFTLPGLPAQL